MESVGTDKESLKTEAYERAMAVADTAESVAETIVRAARDKTPRLRYPSGKAARQAAFARRFVLRALFDKILRSQFGLAYAASVTFHCNAGHLI